MTNAHPDALTGRILVIGGHGAVGTTVTATLGEWFPDRVVPVGRNAARPGAPYGAPVDITDPGTLGRALDHLGDIAAVVLCAEPPDDAVARMCLERGIHLVDIGATPRLLDSVARLGPLAEGAGATAVLSVGVAPGLTNLLARRVHEAVGGADRIDLTVLLGSGERHGADAVRWTVEGLAAPARARPLRVSLPGLGTRTAHPFPFSDQHTLPGTLGVPEVTTRLCLDSRALTGLLFGLRRAGLRELLRRPVVRRALTGVFLRVHTGGEAFALRADARRAGRHAVATLTGVAQSRITGLMAALVTRELLTGTLPPGVHHLDQLPALADLDRELAPYGVVRRDTEIRSRG
ncbi:saccharopine dehydrogenase [Streptomyces sp. NPDC000594]|uniref:saccharopine dehydrogenase n=1 Tax=Streptomyces sp. NPDC000594 TaxID=3154261 RepID=UPI003327A651